MKILFVVHSLGSGGASKQLVMTANAMFERGHEVSVYTYRFQEPPFFPLNAGIRLMQEPHIPRNAKVEYLITPCKIRRMIRRINADVVVGWRTNAGYLVTLACLGLKAKSMFSERSDPYSEDSVILHVAKKICNRADGGVFQTNEARNYYSGLAPRAAVIANPYSTEGPLPDIIPYAEREKLIVCVGRLVLIQKRQDIAIKAFRLFHATHPDYKFIFYGDGKDEDKIRHMVEVEGLSDAVEMRCAVRGVVEKISSAKAMIFSSDYEGIPNVILDAFTAGVPVVSTDCSPGGVRVLITEGKEGFIVPRRDPDALAARLAEITDNPRLAESFIRNGREKIGLFQPEAIFNEWDAYLRRLTGLK